MRKEYNGNGNLSSSMGSGSSIKTDSGESKTFFAVFVYILLSLWYQVPP